MARRWSSSTASTSSKRAAVTSRMRSSDRWRHPPRPADDARAGRGGCMVGDDSSMVTSGDEDVLRMLRDLTRAHPLASFFLLAYGISWACWLPIAFSGGIVRSGNALPTHFPGLLGPMIAAIIVTAITEGRAGLRDLLARMGRWRVGLRWWLFA